MTVSFGARNLHSNAPISNTMCNTVHTRRKAISSNTYSAHLAASVPFGNSSAGEVFLVSPASGCNRKTSNLNQVTLPILYCSIHTYAIKVNMYQNHNLWSMSNKHIKKIPFQILCEPFPRRSRKYVLEVVPKSFPFYLSFALSQVYLLPYCETDI